MAIEAISTAGMWVKYAFESTAGSRPASGYVSLPGVTAIPAFGDTINTLQTTSLDKTKAHTYIRGLADPGGALQLTVNDAPALRSAYETLLSGYSTALSSGLGMWVEYAYPPAYGMDSFYYPAEPAPLGFGGADVDAVLTNMVNFLPQGDYVFASAST